MRRIRKSLNSIIYFVYNQLVCIPSVHTANEVCFLYILKKSVYHLISSIKHLLYIFRIFYSTLFESKQIIGLPPCYYFRYIFANIALFILQVLHVIWAYMICRIIYRMLTTNVRTRIYKLTPYKKY